MSKTTYTISDLAKLAGVSVRTLRYYDEIGLLCPKREDNGYRTYSTDEIQRLQHIMLLRTCGLSLADIATALNKEDFDLATKLHNHLSTLQNQLKDVTHAIETTQKTINELEDYLAMNDTEKFEKLKAATVNQSEKQYGKEARALYGDAAVDNVNSRLLAMNEEEWEDKESLEQRILETLTEAMTTKDPLSPASQMLASMHARWIIAHWGEAAYTPEAHRSLTESYLHDPRFIAYYDTPCGQGATEFLRDVILANIPTN